MDEKIVIIEEGESGEFLESLDKYSEGYTIISSGINHIEDRSIYWAILEAFTGPFIAEVR